MKKLKNQNLVSSVILSFCISACNSKGAQAPKDEPVERKPAPRAFLNLAEVTSQESLTPLKESDLKHILAEPSFYLNMTPDKPASVSESTSNAAYQNCMNQKFANNFYIFAQKSILSMSFEGDQGECNNLLKKPDSPIFYEVDMAKVSNYLQCDGKDFSSLNGKTYGDFLKTAGSAVDCSNPTIQVAQLINSSFKSTYTYTKDNKKYVTAYTTLMMNQESGPCFDVVSGTQIVRQNGCMSIERTQYPILATEPTTSALTVLKKLEYQHIQYPLGRKAMFFSSGSIKFQINNWTGEVVYSDAKTPGTWTAKNTTTNEEASGKLSIPAQ